MEQSLLPVAETLSFEDLSSLCSTNTQFREVCSNDSLWQRLYLRDFGPLEINGVQRTPVSWRLEYLIKKSKQQLFEFNVASDSHFDQVQLPENIGNIKQVAFNRNKNLGWLVTEKGEVYSITRRDRINPNLVDYHFELDTNLFPFPVVQLVTDDNSVTVLDDQGRVHRSRDIYGTPTMHILDIPAPVRKMWNFNELFFLTSDDRIFSHALGQLKSIPELSGQSIQQLGYNLANNHLYVITSTRTFYYYKEPFSSNLNYRELVAIDENGVRQKIIDASQNLVVTVDRRLYQVDHENKLEAHPFLSSSVNPDSSNKRSFAQSLKNPIPPTPISLIVQQLDSHYVLLENGQFFKSYYIFGPLIQLINYPPELINLNKLWIKSFSQNKSDNGFLLASQRIFVTQQLAIQLKAAGEIRNEIRKDTGELVIIDQRGNQFEVTN